MQVSLPNWNQDERFGAYGGAHAMVMGGYGRVTDALAEQITDLKLNSPVSKIVHSPDHVEVHTRQGEVLQADAVIVSIPIGVLKAGSIHFEPALPQWKQTAISRIGMGKLSKVRLRSIIQHSTLCVHELMSALERCPL
jgi:monoamine oxidase